MSSWSIAGLSRLGAPPMKDPRWSVAAVQLLFILLGFTVLSFPVSVAQALTLVVVAVAAELVLGKLVVGRIPFPLSALITGFGLALLLRGEGLAIFALAALAAVGSKYLLRLSDGHIFNPSNFGLVLALALPLGAATITPGQWGGFPLLVLLILGLGYIVVRQANRLWLVGGFAAGLALAATLSGDFLTTFGGYFNAAVLLFAFFMITDPRTSPSTPPAQLLFGLAVGTGGAALGLLGVAAGVFWALLIGSAAYGLLRARGIAPAATRWASFTPVSGSGGGGGGMRPAATLGITPSSSSGGGVTRSAFMRRALLGGAGVGLLAAVGSCSSREGQGGADGESEAQQLEFLKNSFIASGGGINLKAFPSGSGGMTQMRELFSFDRHYAICTVEDVPHAFVMPTHELGEVVIEPHEFYMEMITTEVTDVRVEEDEESGRLVAEIDGSLDCATQAGTSSVSLGSRERSEAERADFTIIARDTTGEELPLSNEPFKFTTYFDKDRAPVNYSIFGPEFTFTGEMISGRITVQPVTDLFPRDDATSDVTTEP